MKLSSRMFGTTQALGIASIIETATSGGFNLDQDLKGRWHVWVSDPVHVSASDHIARHLEPEVYG